METTAHSSTMAKGNNQDPGVSNVEKGAAAVRHAIHKAADTVVNKIAAGAHRGVDKVAGAAAPAAEWLGKAAGKLKQKRRELINGGSEQVRAKPLTYVGMALAIGFLVGRVIR
jgi:ElaB protein